MTRVIKFLLSSIYFVLNRIKHYSAKLLGIKSEPICTVLYYHSIFDNEKQAFERQINLIARKCNVVKSDYFGKLEQSKPNIVITFDDGFENLIRNAIPILKKKSLPFTIFFISNYFGKIPDWEFPRNHPDKKEKIMSLDQFYTLPPELLTVGSHTANHKKLTDLSENEIEIEIIESKKYLESISKKSVDVLAFPNGKYDNNIVEKCINSGYKRVFTIEPRAALCTENENITGRVWANGDDWYLEFWLKINGAYNWLDRIHKLKSKNFRK